MNYGFLEFYNRRTLFQVSWPDRSLPRSNWSMRYLRGTATSISVESKEYCWQINICWIDREIAKIMGKCWQKPIRDPSIPKIFKILNDAELLCFYTCYLILKGGELIKVHKFWRSLLKFDYFYSKSYELVYLVGIWINLKSLNMEYFLTLIYDFYEFSVLIS